MSAAGTAPNTSGGERERLVGRWGEAVLAADAPPGAARAVLAALGGPIAGPPGVCGSTDAPPPALAASSATAAASTANEPAWPEEAEGPDPGLPGGGQPRRRGRRLDADAAVLHRLAHRIRQRPSGPGRPRRCRRRPRSAERYRTFRRRAPPRATPIPSRDPGAVAAASRRGPAEPWRRRPIPPTMMTPPPGHWRCRPKRWTRVLRRPGPRSRPLRRISTRRSRPSP